MSKPEDIPQDVWDAAWKLQGSTTYDEAVFNGADSPALLQACQDDAEAIARAILAAKAEEREAVEPLTVAVAAVVAEAETFAMTMRRRRIFENMKDRLYGYRNRLALDDVSTAHKISGDE